MSDVESDLSDDETEILVYVECEGYVNSNTFKNENLSLDIVGIDSEHPIMQINGKVCIKLFNAANYFIPLPLRSNRSG